MSQTPTKVVIILCGIPTSGKSTYCKNMMEYFPQFTKVISRDEIREEIYGKNYRHNSDSEKKISRIADLALDEYLSDDSVIWIILDNTHCKGAYIDAIRDKIKGKADSIIIHFPISLWKAKFRNISRWWFTGKYIPMSVMNNMYKNYTKLVKSGKYNF